MSKIIIYINLFLILHMQSSGLLGAAGASGPNKSEKSQKDFNVVKNIYKDPQEFYEKTSKEVSVQKIDVEKPINYVKLLMDGIRSENKDWVDRAINEGGVKSDMLGYFNSPYELIRYGVTSATSIDILKVLLEAKLIDLSNKEEYLNSERILYHIIFNVPITKYTPEVIKIFINAGADLNSVNKVNILKQIIQEMKIEPIIGEVFATLLDAFASKGIILDYDFVKYLYDNNIKEAIEKYNNFYLNKIQKKVIEKMIEEVPELVLMPPGIVKSQHETKQGLIEQFIG